MFMFILLFKYNVITAIKQNSEMGVFENPKGGQKGCQRYWWTNFLYIHNFYPKSFWATVCLLERRKYIFRIAKRYT